jgi:hypothetical protein
MTNTNPRDLIKLLIDALKEECNWIDNLKHDELIAKATAYLTQYAPDVLTDEALNSKSSPNNLQIRSFDLDVTIALVQQWTDEIYGGPGAMASSDDLCLAKLAAQYGADQELEACCEWLVSEGWFRYEHEAVQDLRAARRPKPPTLKEQALARTAAILNDPSRALLIEEREALELNLRALEALPND